MQGLIHCSRETGDILGLGVGGKGVEGLSKKEKRTHGHGQQGGDCWRRGIRELNGNGKNIIKMTYFLKDRENFINIYLNLCLERTPPKNVAD